MILTNAVIVLYHKVVNKQRETRMVDANSARNDFIINDEMML